jgi:hypothetical protein
MLDYSLYFFAIAATFRLAIDFDGLYSNLFISHYIDFAASALLSSLYDDVERHSRDFMLYCRQFLLPHCDSHTKIPRTAYTFSQAFLFISAYFTISLVSGPRADDEYAPRIFVAHASATLAERN